MNKIEKEYETVCKCMEGKTNYGMHIYYPRHSKEISISINSCCGGCVCASDIKYCCYCGKELKVKERKE